MTQAAGNQPTQSPNASPAPTAASPSAANSTAAMIVKMRQLVEGNARRWKRLIVLEGVSLAVASVLAYLWLAFLLDNVWHLPVWGRLLGFAGFFVAVVYFGYTLFQRWKQLRLTEDEVALAIEKQTGGVQNSLINAIQLSRSGDPNTAALTGAVLEENYLRLQKIHVEQARQLGPALRRVGVAVAVIALGVAFGMLKPNYFMNSAKRILIPLADVKPIYQTELEVNPGNVETMGGDVTVTINIKGVVPRDMKITREIGPKLSNETIAIPANARQLSYTFKDVKQSMTYSIAANDYTTQLYRIDVPQPVNLSMIKAKYVFPPYTKMDPLETSSASGDMEALTGTQASVTFVLDQPAKEVILLLERVATASALGKSGADFTSGTSGATNKTLSDRRVPGEVQRIALRMVNDNPQEWQGVLVFREVQGYRLETVQAKASGKGDPLVLQTQHYKIRMKLDQPPKIDWTGMDAAQEVVTTAVFPVKGTISDDIGIDKAGFFYRPIKAGASEAPKQRAEVAPDDDDDPDRAALAAAKNRTGDEDWRPLQVWDGHYVDKAKNAERYLSTISQSFNLAIESLGAMEGERFEIALRAKDTDPLKTRWITGKSVTVSVGGDGNGLQLYYERLIRSEKAMKELIAAQKSAVDGSAEWMVKLDPQGATKWDDPTNEKTLIAAMRKRSESQTAVRDGASALLRDMVEQLQSVKGRLAMLGDTEMVQAIRGLDTIAVRESTEGKRAALQNVKAAQERTSTGLDELYADMVKFREEWEVNNMVSYVKLLADRQTALQEESAKRASTPSATKELEEMQRTGASRRQARMTELTALAVTATARIGQLKPTDELPDQLIKAYGKASGELAAPALNTLYTSAAQSITSSKWADAAVQQGTAADTLLRIFGELRKVQNEVQAARKDTVPDDIDGKAKSQGAIAEQEKGEGANVKFEKDQLSELIAQHNTRAVSGENKDAKDKRDAELMFSTATGDDEDDGVRQDPSVLTLGTKPMGANPPYSNASDRKANEVRAYLNKDFEDVMGDMIQSTDDANQEYAKLMQNSNFGISEAGDIGRDGGDINSVGANAATGNQEPPPNDAGGASRSGRKGGRSHGNSVSDEDANAQGKSKPLESDDTQKEDGVIKGKKATGPKTDTSVGTGGKKVEGLDNGFAKNTEKGSFDADDIKDMDPPKEHIEMAQKKGEKFSPELMESMRDPNSKVKQTIDNIKALKKDLKNLYLPAGKLAALEAELSANLEQLKERPTPELVRRQMRALEQLKQTLKVLDRARSSLQPTLPRNQEIRSAVLDEPSRATVPGYEDAVKRYYEMLAVP